MKRTRIIAILVAAGAVILGLSAYFVSYAYLTGTSSKTSGVMHAGENKVEIVENFEPPEDLQPGGSFKKDVKVKNVGNIDVYTRVLLLFSDSDIEELCEDLKIGNDWIKGSDGYYYYNNVLSPQQLTSSLITSITIKKVATIGNKLHSFDIIVYAESVDAKGHSSYLDAWGI